MAKSVSAPTIIAMRRGHAYGEKYAFLASGPLRCARPGNRPDRQRRRRSGRRTLPGSAYACRSERPHIDTHDQRSELTAALAAMVERGRSEVDRIKIVRDKRYGVHDRPSCQPAPVLQHALVGEACTRPLSLSLRTLRTLRPVHHRSGAIIRNPDECLRYGWRLARRTKPLSRLDGRVPSGWPRLG